jgi:hypothetical protein
MLSLLLALQWLFRLEASAVQIYTAHPTLAPVLLTCLQPGALHAVERFSAATGLTSSGRPPAEVAVAAAAAGALVAPFAHVHAVVPPTPQAEAALAALQQALAVHPLAVPSLLHCLQLAPSSDSDGEGGDQSAAAADSLLGSSVGLLARVVMASDRAMAQFVSAGGMAPEVVDK